jgi:hypothetical protein
MHGVPDQSKRKPRGIIVVDTCALLNLCVPIPDRFIHRQAKAFGHIPQLSDALFYLTEQGYDVIIPEMVAHEAGHYMRDGTSVHQHFHNLPNDGFYKVTASFFHKVRQNAFEPSAITIEPPLADDHSADATLLNNLYAAHTDPHFTPRERCQAIIGITHHHKHSQHAGENAAFQLIQSLPASKTPVYFLSDDVMACETLMQKQCNVPVHILGSAGFYTALQKNNVLPKLGIVPVPHQDIAKRMLHPSGHRGQTIADSASVLDKAQCPDSPGSQPFHKTLGNRYSAEEVYNDAPEPVTAPASTAPKPVVNRIMHKGGGLKTLIEKFKSPPQARQH